MEQRKSSQKSRLSEGKCSFVVQSPISNPGPSDAVAQQCDVTSWEQQLALFQFAMRTYSRIDIVVPNAGVTELGAMTAVRASAVNGVPTKPNLKTIEVNLIAVLYCAFISLVSKCN